MSRTKASFLGSISSQIFMIVTMLLTMVITPIILGYLNKEEYGFYTIVFQIIGYLSIMDFGLGSAITRSLAANKGETSESKLAINQVISTSFFIYSLLGIGVIVIGFWLSPMVPGFFEMPDNMHEVAVLITLTLTVFVGIQFPIRVFNSIFYAHKKQLLSNVMSFSINILNSLLPILFLYYEAGLWAFVYTNIVCSIIEIAIIFFLVTRHYPFIKVRTAFFDSGLLKEMFHFGFFMFLGTIAYQIVFFTDRFFIGSLVSLAAATVFALSIKASDLAREFIFRIADHALPSLMELGSEKKFEKVKIIHQKLMLITVCLSSIAFWMIYILNPWFLNLWVGNSFYIGGNIMILMLVIMFQHNILHVSSHVLFSIGVVKGASIMAIAEAAINLVLTITLGKLYGIKGILIATIIASWLTVVWYLPHATIKNLKITLKEYFLDTILIPLFATSIFGFGIYLLTHDFFNERDLNWFSFCVVAFILGSVFALFAWIAFLKKELMEYIPLRFRRFLFPVKTL